MYKNRIFLWWFLWIVVITMVVKVRHKELMEVKSNMINNSEELDIEINNILQYLNELKGVWQGEDADIFYEEAYNYINRMKTITNCFDVLGNFINDVNHSYEVSDMSLKEELEKEANNYEYDNYNQFGKIWRNNK